MKEIIIPQRGDIEKSGNFIKREPDFKFAREIQAFLQETVFGQEEATFEVARALARAETGLAFDRRPHASLFFAGAPGTGKTEMGRAIAKYFHKDQKGSYEDRLKIIDCASLSQPHDIMRLTGAPPSYVGYGDEILIQPDFLNQRNVIVFDEIEKAHPNLYRVLLSVLDKGKLQVNLGTSSWKSAKPTELSFVNSVIIFTSNIGSIEAQKVREGREIGFATPTIKENKNSYSSTIRKEIKEYFKFIPEFLDRLDAIVVFNELGEEEYRRILNKFISEFNNTNYGGVFLSLTQELFDFIIKNASHNKGGRGLKRFFEKEVLSQLADVIDEKGENIFVGDLDDNQKIIFWKLVRPKNDQ
jgi:ATP-dependent Clp protease ATP-binding subunit ClpC